MEKPYEGFGKYVGLAVLGSVAGRYIKQVIIVDADIDPFDPIQVEWAVSTRVQANRDIEILKQLTGIFSIPLSQGRAVDHLADLEDDHRRDPLRCQEFSANLFAGKRSDGQSGKRMGALRYSTRRSKGLSSAGAV